MLYRVKFNYDSAYTTRKTRGITKKYEQNKNHSSKFYSMQHLSMALRSLFMDPVRFSVSLILSTVGRTPWNGDQPVAEPLLTRDRLYETSNYKITTKFPNMFWK
jgi:hypothetical protein